MDLNGIAVLMFTDTHDVLSIKVSCAIPNVFHYCPLLSHYFLLVTNL